MVRSSRVDGTHRIVSVVVLLLGVAGSLVGAGLWQASLQTAAEQRVDRQAQEAVNRLVAGFEAYGRALEAERALYAAAQGQVSYPQYRSFVAGLDLPRSYPGLQGMTFHQVVTEPELEAFVAENRADGRPDFTVTPPGARPEQWVVRFSEPRPVPPWGVDTRLNDEIRPFMEQARDSGQLTLSGISVLANDRALPLAEQPAAFGLFQPIYRPGADTGTVQGRRDGIIGWASAPFRAQDLLDGIRTGTSRLGVEAFDQTASTGTRLGASPAGFRPGGPLVRTRTVDLGGREWVLRFGALPGTDLGPDHTGPGLVAVGGAAVSALLATLLWVRGVNAAHRARSDRALRTSADELRRSEALFRSAFDDSMLGMTLIDVAGRYVRVNRVFAAMIGRTPAELVGRSFRELTHPDDAAADAAAVQSTLTGQTSGIVRQKRYLHTDGSTVYVQLSTSLVRDADDRPLHYATQYVDITEQRRLQRERDTHDLLLRAVIANSQSSIYVKDLDGRYLLANERFRRAFGVTEAEILGQDDTFLDADLAPVWRANDLRALREEFDVLEWSDGPAGRCYYESVKFPLRDPDGAVYAVCGVSLDVTRTRQAADQMERLLAALSDLGEGVCVTEHGRFVYANEAYARLIGYPVGELIGLAAAVLPADDAAAADFAGFVAMLDEPGRTASLISTRIRRRDGRAVPVEVTGISVDNNGTLQRISVLRDLTEAVAAGAELSRRAAALEQANVELAAARDAATAASRAKSAFVARMSHEIRTPLNGVLGLTSLLCGTDLTDSQRHLAETAAASGNALLEVVNDILDFSKIEAGAVTLESLLVDVPALLEEVVATFGVQSAAKGVDLLVECPHQLTVTSDPTRVRQVLTNLLGNALKFTAAGHITLTARSTPDGLAVTVADTGVGISPEAQHRLFTAFEQADSSTTRQYGGTGLGLTISRQLAGLLGGRLELDGSGPDGSAFTLTLPGPARAEETPATLTGRTVLVLAESPALRRHLRTQLAGWGATVVDGAGPDGAGPDGAGPDGAGPDGAGPDVDLTVLDTRLAGAGSTAERWSARAPLVTLTPLGGVRPPRTPAGATPGRTVDLTLPLLPSRLLRGLETALARGDVLPATTSVPVSRPAEPEPGEVGRSLRVLVADDNHVNRLVASLMVRQLGHESDTVEDGQQAVDAALSTRYDLVLMDCQMPVLDGLQATRRLRAEPATATLPIVALTAAVTSEERQACVEAGMDGWLSKPLRLEELRHHLDGRRVGQESPA